MADIRPFHSLTTIEGFVIEEFKRREQDYNLVNDQGSNGAYQSQYRGPQKVWVRMFSNAKGGEEAGNSKEGFLMQNYIQNNSTFEDEYGMSERGRHVIGVDINKNPIVLPVSDQLFLPRPGILSVNTELQGGDGGKFRKTTVRWLCWGFEQLNFLEKYFMRPSITCFVDWGWNNCDQNSIIDISDTNLKEMWNNEDSLWKKIELSKGCYDASLGKIFDYSYTQQPNGSFEVLTVIGSINQYYSGFSPKNLIIKDEKNEQKQSIKEFCENFLDKFISSNNIDDVLKGVNVGKRYFRPKDTKKNNIAWVANEIGHSNTDVWITFSLLVDILNAFLESKFLDQSDIKFFNIDISQSWISAHPNLKSSDGNILLIPNQYAPKGFEYDFGGLATAAACPVQEANVSLYNAFKSNKRDDHNKILNINRGATTDGDTHTCFPFYGKIDGYSANGYAGQLGNLYVNVPFIKKIMSSAENVGSALKNILDGMSGAAGSIWNFDIRQLGNKSGGNSNKLTIVDTNFIGTKTILDWIKQKATTNTEGNGQSTYVFNVGTRRSIVTNYGFNMKLANNVAIDTLYANGKAEDAKNSETNSNPFSQNVDRWGGGETTGKGPDIPKEIEKTSTRQITDNRFFYLKLPTGGGGEEFQEIFLVEPYTDILKASLNDTNLLNVKNNSIFPGLTIDMTFLGIAGLRHLDCFMVRPVPKVYENTLFQITNITHDIQDSRWETKIKAVVRPCNPPLK